MTNDQAEWPANQPQLTVEQQVVERAVERFLAANFTIDSVIPRAWFITALEIEEQRPDMPFADGQKLQLQFLSRFDNGFRPALLVEHSIALRTNYGGGYTIVPPKEQARWAQDTLNNDLKSSFKKAGQRATYIRTEGLSDAERNERVRVLAGIAATEAAVSGERLKMKRRAAVHDADQASAARPKDTAKPS
jgi:hypothetical protein